MVRNMVSGVIAVLCFSVRLSFLFCVVGLIIEGLKDTVNESPTKHLEK